MLPRRRPLIIASVAAAALMLVATARAADPDLSTPKAAIKSLQDAVAAQDGDAANQTLYAADQVDKDLARAFADLLVAGRKLNDATRDKFGATGPAAGAGAAAGEALAGLDKAQITINGDTATLTPAGASPRPIHLKRAKDGKWQLVVRDFANAADPDLPAQTAVLKKVGQVFADIAAQIESDKFSGPQDAEAAIQSRLATILISASRASAIKADAAAKAATRPATKPVTNP